MSFKVTDHPVLLRMASIKQPHWIHTANYPLPRSHLDEYIGFMWHLHFGNKNLNKACFSYNKKLWISYLPEYLLPQPQEFKRSVWPCPLTYWSENGMWHIIPSWVVFVQHLNIIHKQAIPWLNNLEDIGQSQRSLLAKNPLMLVIIWIFIWKQLVVVVTFIWWGHNRMHCLFTVKP